MSEYDEALAVFDYAYGYGGNLDPRLHMLHPVENTKGAGRPPAGATEAAGVFDHFLAVAIAPFHGLYIELKTPKGKPSAKQLKWQKKARGQGYAAEIVYGADKEIELLDQYLAGELSPF